MRTLHFVAFVVVFSLVASFSFSAQEQPVNAPNAVSPQVETAQPTPPAAAPLIPPKEHSVLGELEIVTFNSKIFRNIRNLRVWLPGNYFAPVNRNKHYPVLYM